MKRLIVGIVVVVVLLVAAAIVLPFVIPTDMVKERALAAAREATGREVRIDGVFELNLGLTTSLLDTFSVSTRAPSRLKYASGAETLRLDESSRVRSNHWVAAVKAGSWARAITCRARPQIRSARIGLRL